MLFRFRTRPGAAALIEDEITAMQVGSAYLKMHASEESDVEAARVLQSAAKRIDRLSERLARLIREQPTN